MQRYERLSGGNKIFPGSKSRNTKGVEIIGVEQTLFNSCQQENIVSNKGKKMEIDCLCVWKKYRNTLFYVMDRLRTYSLEMSLF